MARCAQIFFPLVTTEMNIKDSQILASIAREVAHDHGMESSQLLCTILCAATSMAMRVVPTSVALEPGSYASI